jgi:hypothetical protein
VATSQSSDTRAMQAAAAQRLSAEAKKAVLRANAAKQQVRAAKILLKRARKLAKASKKAAKQARKKAKSTQLALQVRAPTPAAPQNTAASVKVPAKASQPKPSKPKASRPKASKRSPRRVASSPKTTPATLPIAAPKATLAPKRPAAPKRAAARATAPKRAPGPAVEAITERSAAEVDSLAPAPDVTSAG